MLKHVGDGTVVVARHPGMAQPLDDGHLRGIRTRLDKDPPHRESAAVAALRRFLDRKLAAVQ